MLQKSKPEPTRFARCVSFAKKYLLRSFLVIVVIGLLYSPFAARSYYLKNKYRVLYVEKMQLLRYSDLFKRDTEKHFDVGAALRSESERIAVYQDQVDRYVYWQAFFLSDCDMIQLTETHFLWFDNWAMLDIKNRRGEHLSAREMRSYERLHEEPQQLASPKVTVPQVASDQR